MNVKINEEQFIDLMEKTSFKYDFTREGLEAIYDYYKFIDQDIRFDAQFISEEFVQYKTKKDILKGNVELKEEELDRFIEYMGIIKLDTGGYVEHKRDF